MCEIVLYFMWLCIYDICVQIVKLMGPRSTCETMDDGGLAGLQELRERSFGSPKGYANIN